MKHSGNMLTYVTINYKLFQLQTTLEGTISVYIYAWLSKVKLFCTYTHAKSEIYTQYLCMVFLLANTIWGEILANWLVLSIWWKKIWRINKSANRWLIISTNLDVFSLANHGQFAKFANVSPHQSFPPYGINLSMSTSNCAEMQLAA